MSLSIELDFLNQMILRMASLVEKNLVEALDAYLNYNPQKEYDEINDDIIDAKERAIEEECINIMLKERPFSRDLRRVSGILRLVEDLERLGDHAEDIMSFSMKLKNVERVRASEIDSLAKKALNMVHNAIDSFVNKSIALAREIIDSDDVVDLGYSNIIDSLILDLKENKISSEFAIYTTLVVKYVERIADHAVNIAEWVIYIENGYHKDKQICWGEYGLFNLLNRGW